MHALPRPRIWRGPAGFNLDQATSRPVEVAEVARTSMHTFTSWSPLRTLAPCLGWLAGAGLFVNLWWPVLRLWSARADYMFVAVVIVLVLLMQWARRRKTLVIASVPVVLLLFVLMLLSSKPVVSSVCRIPGSPSVLRLYHDDSLFGDDETWIRQEMVVLPGIRLVREVFYQPHSVSLMHCRFDHAAAHAGGVTVPLKTLIWIGPGLLAIIDLSGGVP